jgi:hypothetical protein
MRECVDQEDFQEKEVLQGWQASLEQEENKDLQVLTGHQGSLVPKELLDTKDLLV